MFEGILQWYDSIWGHQGQVESAVRSMQAALTEETLDTHFNSLPIEIKSDPAVVSGYMARLEQVRGVKIEFRDPLAKFIDGRLTDWVEFVKQYNDISPEESQKALSDLSAKVIELFGASAAIDMAAGMWPGSAGDASAINTKELLKWLGFGAIIAAIAHDPVKIGILRPYSDMLEATFRNRKPEYVGILNAYKQRSLSTISITNTDDITDEIMDEIEVDNNVNMDAYGAQWGYPQKWINIEKDAATKAMTFGNLMAMARLGYYDRGMSIFSLWTYGIDRRLMKNALQAIETSRDVGMWKGFRSMVEPSYVQGLIEESDLTEYWTKILVPADVQEWALARLRNSRAKFAAKELKLQNAASKDLTKSDWTKAYQLNLISLIEYQSKLTTLGYDQTEIALLVKLADAGKKTSTSGGCKKLPLTDYELAHRNGLITSDQVLERMAGEYCEADIALEKQLIAIDDLTSEAPARERDLTVSQLGTAYQEDIIDLATYKTSLSALGFDDTEVAVLLQLADAKKDISSAKAKKTKNVSGVAAERDLTLSQLTTAYVQNVIDEASYVSDIESLGYDAAETAILLKLAQIKKKLPSLEGLKHLPLGDYEKAWKYGQITSDQVLESMRGVYTEADIQLERLLLLVGKP